VVAVILIFVIPVFESMFADFGKALPVPTQIVVAMSEFLKNYILYIIVGFVLFVFAFRRFYKTDKGSSRFPFSACYSAR
jgi:type IV pilus assembly protein PilC